MREGSVALPDGRSISFAEHGRSDGPTIMYQHPMPAARSFNLEAEALRSVGARSLTMERPGIGLSTRAPGRALSSWADDVARVADTLEIDRFAVLGVSGGGPYALALAHRLPDRVTRVGLACAVGPILDHPEFDDLLDHPLKALLPFAREDADAAEELLRGVLAPMGERYRADPDAFFEEWVQGWPEDQQVLYRQNKARWMAALEATYRDTEGFADEVAAGLQWDFDPAEIDVPLRAWHGTADQAAPLGLIRLVVEQVGGELVEYPGLGHYLPPEYHTDWVRWLVGGATDDVSSI